MSDVLGIFEQAVLVTVLHLRGEGYGRTIHQDVQARLGREVAASAVYATLDRLEAKALLRSREGETTPERGGRAKRHFSVTAAGVSALTAARTATRNIWRGVTLPLKARS